MIEAVIYFCGTPVKTIMLEFDEPPLTIREMAPIPLSVIAFTEGDEEAMRPVEMNIWIFRLKKQIGFRQFRYDFDGAQSNVNFARPRGRTVDFGFDDIEPTEKVNLNILAEKCKKNKKVKDLLIKYFRA